MANTRTSILSNIVDTLGGISITSGYETDVELVVDRDARPEDYTAQNVILGVFPRAYAFGPSETRFDKRRDMQNVLLVGVRALVRTDVDGAERKKTALMGDILKALWVDSRRGVTDRPVDTVAVDFTDEFVSFEQGSGALAEFLAIIRVTWLSSPDNP